MDVDIVLQDEDAAWKVGLRMREQAGGRPGRAPEIEYENADLLNWNLLPWRDATIDDVKAHSGIGANTADAAPAIADIDERLHDPRAAELALQTSPGSESDP